jgi:two-component system response regulator (stage 0 sporulation protein F)
MPKGESGLPRDTKLIPRNRHRILLVDDDAKDLLYYSAILQHEGHEVRSIASYKEAADCFDREDFDLVIVSQGTAAFEGRHVLARVLGKDHTVPTLVLSRNSDIDCYLEAMQMGAFDYREKPLAACELAEVVATHFRPSSFRAA